MWTRSATGERAGLFSQEEWTRNYGGPAVWQPGSCERVVVVVVWSSLGVVRGAPSPMPSDGQQFHFSARVEGWDPRACPPWPGAPVAPRRAAATTGSGLSAPMHSQTARHELARCRHRPCLPSSPPPPDSLVSSPLGTLVASLAVPRPPPPAPPLCVHRLGHCERGLKSGSAWWSSTCGREARVQLEGPPRRIPVSFLRRADLRTHATHLSMTALLVYTPERVGR